MQCRDDDDDATMVRMARTAAAAEGAGAGAAAAAGAPPVGNPPTEILGISLPKMFDSGSGFGMYESTRCCYSSEREQATINTLARSLSLAARWTTTTNLGRFCRSISEARRRVPTLVNVLEPHELANAWRVSCFGLGIVAWFIASQEDCPCDLMAHEH